MHKPIILVVLDGWGLSESTKGNAIAEANIPTANKLNNYYPQVALQASGISVGLPWGEAGNSEVGHMTLGTGRVIYQSMPRITLSIQNGDFFSNPAFLKATAQVKNNNSALHLIGLIGKGSIHSHMDHLYALLDLAKRNGVEKVFLHVFTDGRDCSPTAGAEVVRDLLEKIKEIGIGKIATIGGRYFGMDRNNNWDRVKKAYDAMVFGSGPSIIDPVSYLKESYQKSVFDEYIVPAVVAGGDKPASLIKNGDSIIFFNFREDRARQITQSFIMKDFSKFKTDRFDNLVFVSMIQYENDFPCDVAFGPISITQSLGEILSLNGRTQLRISETEKFAHVTYFFNGGSEEPFPMEDRIIVPSKSVATFDQAPEMSALEITEKVCELIQQNKYDFILMNYANPDIVGHTGNEEATIKAVETVDRCLEKVIKETLLKDGCLLITADHGNAEEVMSPKTGEIDTEHSVNPVPLWFVTATNHCETSGKCYQMRVAGLLSDVAPTILNLLGIKKPADMSGESLLPMLK
jgi:2,3-bisphosphoglycerate-independent phosphoglycerate mutase